MPVKKILLLYTNPENSEKAVQVCIKMARKERASVHVIELRQRTSAPQFQYPFMTDLTLSQTPIYEGVIEVEDIEMGKDISLKLQKRFELSGIPFSHSSDDIFLDQIIDYTAFADLLIADAHLNLGEFLTAPIDASLEKLRARSHCPFYLANDTGSEVEKIILAYDGKNASMQAIKTFSYLFPDSSDLPVEVVSILENGQESIEEEYLLKQWLSLHFADAKIHVLHGKTTDTLIGFLDAQDENVLVVMGVHAGDSITSLFHKSTGPEVIRQIHRAVFS
ncbi:MAG: universal stress protein [Chitinophagaceae bacterium]